VACNNRYLWQLILPCAILNELKVGLSFPKSIPKRVRRVSRV